jgi:hypothetical protein
VTAAVILAACALIAAVFVLTARAEDRRDDRRPGLAFGAGLIVSPVEGYDLDWLPVPEVHHDEYAQAPTRGDAQGRAVRVCATVESRPAPGADLTGSLSPRPPKEGPQVASAPPPGGTPDVPGRDTTPAGDQAPGPRLPEGDTAGPWPPQEAGPGDLPPMSPLLATAMRELEDAERWPHLAPAAGYAASRPFRDWERDSIVMQAVK